MHVSVIFSSPLSAEQWGLPSSSECYIITLLLGLADFTRIVPAARPKRVASVTWPNSVRSPFLCCGLVNNMCNLPHILLAVKQTDESHKFKNALKATSARSTQTAVLQLLVRSLDLCQGAE